MTKKTVDDFYQTIEQAATAAAPLFTLYGWTYGDKDTPATHSDIRNTIERLAESVLKEANKPGFDGSSRVSSGRFIVGYDVYDDERELWIALDLASESEYKEF